MIQRIQSVYLLLGALALAALCFFETLWSSAPAQEWGWFTPAAFVLVGVAGIAAVAAIFLYQDRSRQRTVVLAAQIFTMLLVVLLFGGLYGQGALGVRTAGGGVNVGRLVALLLPVVAYVFFFLARRAIESDMALVRSMDRLRG